MGLYRQAAFCLEELLTMGPGEPNLHIRYADTLLTLGGPTNARTARAHYSKAATLTRGAAARPLYGLLACAAALQVRQRDVRRVCARAGACSRMRGAPMGTCAPAECGLLRRSC